MIDYKNFYMKHILIQTFHIFLKRVSNLSWGHNFYVSYQMQQLSSILGVNQVKKSSSCEFQLKSNHTRNMYNAKFKMYNWVTKKDSISVDSSTRSNPIIYLYLLQTMYPYIWPQKCTKTKYFLASWNITLTF